MVMVTHYRYSWHWPESCDLHNLFLFDCLRYNQKFIICFAYLTPFIINEFILKSIYLGNTFKTGGNPIYIGCREEAFLTLQKLNWASLSHKFFHNIIDLPSLILFFYPLFSLKMWERKTKLLYVPFEESLLVNYLIKVF